MAVQGWLGRSRTSCGGATAATLETLEARLLLAGDDLLFLHHSCGGYWLDDGLRAALEAKGYVDEVNEITYGTDVAPDAGRPDSLASTPGDSTDMCHWVLWFNDYHSGMASHGCTDGVNRIILFKSCYPISNVAAATPEPGDPFSATQNVTNYRAVYRHPSGAGNTYIHGAETYSPLEDIFAGNPGTLFIPVTAPPRHYGPADATDDAEAHNARVFNDWLKNDWLTAYDAAHPGLNNVAVFDWFDFLAYPDDHATHPNRLRLEYGGNDGDSHPSRPTANVASTEVFATNPANFIDQAGSSFPGGAPAPVSLTTPAVSGEVARGETFRIEWTGGGAGATLAMWALGPAGLGPFALGVAATSGHCDWDSTPAGYGWYFFVACVTDGGSYVAAGPAWLRVVEAAGPPATVQAAPSGGGLDVLGSDDAPDSYVAAEPGAVVVRSPTPAETFEASAAGCSVLSAPVWPGEPCTAFVPALDALPIVGEDRLLAGGALAPSRRDRT